MEAKTEMGVLLGEDEAAPSTEVMAAVTAASKPQDFTGPPPEVEATTFGLGVGATATQVTS